MAIAASSQASKDNMHSSNRAKPACKKTVNKTSWELHGGGGARARGFSDLKSEQRAIANQARRRTHRIQKKQMAHYNTTGWATYKQLGQKTPLTHKRSSTYRPHATSLFHDGVVAAKPRASLSLRECCHAISCSQRTMLAATLLKTPPTGKPFKRKIVWPSDAHPTNMHAEKAKTTH